MTQFIQALLDGISQGGTFAVLAVGLAIVSAVLSFPNFAHGWLVVWVAMLTVGLADGLPMMAALVAGTVVGIALSLLCGLLVLGWRSKPAGEIMMLISLAFGLALQSLAVLIFGESPRLFSAPQWFGVVLPLGGLRISLASISTAAIATVTVVALLALLHRTDLGLMMRAVARDRATAALVGIRTGRVVGTALVLAGVLAGIAAFLWFAKAGSVTPRMGMDISMSGFVALVIGGLRSVGGAVLGGLILGIVNAMLATYLPPNIQGFAVGLTYALLIAILLVRPDGLLQRKVVMTR